MTIDPSNNVTLTEKELASSDKAQILALLGAGIVESVMSAAKDGGEPKLKRGWQEA